MSKPVTNTDNQEVGQQVKDPTVINNKTLKRTSGVNAIRASSRLSKKVGTKKATTDGSNRINRSNGTIKVSQDDINTNNRVKKYDNKDVFVSKDDSSIPK